MHDDEPIPYRISSPSELERTDIDVAATIRRQLVEVVEAIADVDDLAILEATARRFAASARLVGA